MVAPWRTPSTRARRTPTGSRFLSTSSPGSRRRETPPHFWHAPPRTSPRGSVQGAPRSCSSRGTAFGCVPRSASACHSGTSNAWTRGSPGGWRAAANDADAAARTAATALGHHAVVVRADDGTLLALHAEDKECREAALEASAKVEAPPGSGVRVGVARHDRPYEPSEEQLAGRA